MGRRKKLINNSGIPQHEVEKIARCILPNIFAFYDSEEGQREFAEWKRQRISKTIKTAAATRLPNDSKARNNGSRCRY